MKTLRTRAGLLAGAALLSVVGAAQAQETMYALSSPTSPQLWSFDITTGLDTFIGGVTGAEAIFSGMDFDENGDLFCIDGFNDAFSDRLFLIDEATGAGSVVGDTGENWNFRSVAFDASTGTLYTARDNRLYTTDRATGLVTFVANITGAGLDQLTGFAIDADGNAWGSDIGDCTIFSIDLTTGAATQIGNAFPGTRNWFNDLAVSSDGTLWGAREQGGGIFSIDTSTADATLEFGLLTYRSIAFEGSAAPCRADFDGDGDLTIFDFLAFQNAF
ncbi:MAG: hypothetical protein ACIAQU_02670, partial [Phycisphaerales bacterium JB064]